METNSINKILLIIGLVVIVSLLILWGLLSFNNSSTLQGSLKGSFVSPIQPVKIQKIEPTKPIGDPRYR